MKETRAAKYGRNLAVWITYTIDTIEGKGKKQYITRFLEELRTYSFEPRKSGTPPNSGCVYELSGLIEINVKNPEHLSKLVKEGIHLLYQKGTARRIIKTMLEYIDDIYLDIK